MAFARSAFVWLMAVSVSLGQDISISDQTDQVDYTILQQFCMSQPVTTNCPIDAQFCGSAKECPTNFACSCMQGCGNLSCLLPQNVQVCGCHPPPRNGYTLNRIDSVEFLCDPGYHLEGVTRKTCREGVWLPPQSFPKCSIRMCTELPTFANGNTFFNPTNEPQKFNTTATHSCSSGYSVFGNKQQTCQVDGTWSGQLPECRRDGYWSEYSEWSQCDAVCGQGLMRRNRTCNEPEEGGKPCPEGDDEEIDVCDTGKVCETTRLGCFSQQPWKADETPIKIEMIHDQLDIVHRCMHRCRKHSAIYGAVRGQRDCWCFNEYELSGIVPTCSATDPLYEVYPVPQAAQCYRRVTRLVPKVVTRVVYTPRRYTTGCGFWNWGRCTRYRASSSIGTITIYNQVTRIIKC